PALYYRVDWLSPGYAYLAVCRFRVDCFAADCLETLEEIAEQNREVFLGAGGKKYEYIPALNATPEHIEMMANLVAAYR
ncbi:ferrochelatase, partial [Escherichia sp. R-CC3]